MNNGSWKKYLKYAAIAFGGYMAFKWWQKNKNGLLPNGNGVPRDTSPTSICPPGMIKSMVTGECTLEDDLSPAEKAALDQARNPPPYVEPKPVAEPPPPPPPTSGGGAEYMVTQPPIQRSAIPPHVIQSMKDWRHMNNVRAQQNLPMIQMPPLDDFMQGSHWDAYVRYASPVGLVAS